jgi:hypothetical protein
VKFAPDGKFVHCSMMATREILVIEISKMEVTTRVDPGQAPEA